VRTTGDSRATLKVRPIVDLSIVSDKFKELTPSGIATRVKTG